MNTHGFIYHDDDGYHFVLYGRRCGPYASKKSAERMRDLLTHSTGWTAVNDPTVIASWRELAEQWREDARKMRGDWPI